MIDVNRYNPTTYVVSKCALAPTIALLCPRARVCYTAQHVEQLLPIALAAHGESIEVVASMPGSRAARSLTGRPIETDTRALPGLAATAIFLDPLGQ
jgi:hypothetical protein